MPKKKLVKLEDVIRVQSLESAIMAQVEPELAKRIKRIAHFVANSGFSLYEACKVVGIDPEKFEKLLNTNDAVNEMLEVKGLEYKSKLLEAITLKAKTDDKLAQWLLERRFPNEYASPKRGGGGKDDEEGNILFQAVQFIQQNRSTKPIVQIASGELKTTKQKQAVIEADYTVDDILGGDKWKWLSMKK